MVSPPAGLGVNAWPWFVLLLALGGVALVWQWFIRRRRTADLSAKAANLSAGSDGQAADLLASRKLYEQELWINQFAQQASSLRDLDAVLFYTSKEISRRVPASQVAIFVPEAPVGKLKLGALASHGDTLLSPLEPLPYQNLAQDAFRQGKMQREDVSGEVTNGPIANLALPLRHEGTISGVVLFEKVRTSPAGWEESALAERLVEIAAVAIDRAHALRELENRSQAWAKTFASTWAELEKVFEGLADPAFVHSPDYTILQFNEAFRRRVARPASGIEGQKCYKVLFHKSAPCFYCPYHREERETAAHTAEVPQASEQGTLRILSVSRVDAEGQNLGALEIVRDSSVELRLHEQLLHSEKLASIGRLVSGIAHELNNPLTAILGHAQLLERRASDAKMKDQVRMILEEASRASKIVRNLLTFARKHRPEQQVIDVNDVVRKTLALREYELRANAIQVVVNLVPGLPVVVADFHQLQQVLLNLIGNAEDAMLGAHGQGVLTIESSLEDDRVCLKVRDNGPGIPPEICQRLFDPFFTTKPLGKGTGLGLSICFGILSEHRGKITVESQPGEGATFIVSLPLAGERAEELSAEQPTQPFLLPRKKILLSSDDAELCDNLEDMLKPAGALVEIETSREHGLAKCLSGGYDLIFADWGTPGEDRLVDWLRNDRPQLATRCILLANKLDHDQVQKFCEQSGAAWLQKPIMFAELRVVVDRVLRQASTVSEKQLNS